MTSKNLDKLASQFNYNLCISDSLYEFNNLVNGISNDYPKYLDIYKKEIIKYKLNEQNQQFYEQFNTRLRTPDFEKQYQQLLNLIKTEFSNDILNIIKEIVDEYKYSSQQAVFIITEIRDFLDRYTKEENYNSIYSAVAAIQRHPFAGLALSRNGVSQWKTDAYLSKFQIYEHFFEIFFVYYYNLSSIKNEELNIENYPFVYYYLTKFFKPLELLMGIINKRIIEKNSSFIPMFEHYTNVPKLSYCFNFLNKTTFPDEINIGFMRDYLICIKELLDCIIRVDNNFKNTNNNYTNEDEEKEKINLLESRLKDVEEKHDVLDYKLKDVEEKHDVLDYRLKNVDEKHDVLDQNMISTIRELGALQDNPMLSKKGGKTIVKSKKRKYNKQNKSRRKH